MGSFQSFNALSQFGSERAEGQELARHLKTKTPVAGGGGVHFTPTGSHALAPRTPK